MKKLIYFLFASVAAFSHAKTVPQLTLYEYMYLNSSDKEIVSDYIRNEYGDWIFIAFTLHIDSAFSMAKAQCDNPEKLANFYKKKCNEMKRELKNMTLGDVFKEMEKNL